MKALLEVDNLSKIFYRDGKPVLTAVDHVSFQVYPGEILGIVGESGSGKSTIAKLITRLIDATEGSIKVDGQDITHLKGRQLKEAYREIQMVFQTPTGSFDPRRTLGDGICESLRNNGVSKNDAEKRGCELLAQCGLSEEFMKRYPHEVSGGQCQRAAIARALAIRPDILICDEATSSLDATVQKQVIDLLTALKESTGMAYVFICHNLALVQQFCDRVLVMCDGKIVEEGTPDDVIMRPAEEYTKNLIDSIL